MEEMRVVSEGEVQGLVGEGASLVTVNRRLAKYAMDRYSCRQIEMGCGVWETPDILSFGGWVERCLEESAVRLRLDGKDEYPMLLSPLQEQMVWEQLIEDSLPDKTLLHRRGAARMAQQAWQLCVAWRVPINSGSLWNGVDCGAFAIWADAFEARCNLNHWLDRARLVDLFKDAVARGDVDLPGVLVFSGFDDFPPQVEELIGVLVSKKVALCMQAFPVRAGRGVRIGYPDDDREMEAAAKWARTRLRTNPGDRVGVIVNGLGQKRDTVCRVFEDILRPSSMVSFECGNTPVFNISMGKPLLDYPLVGNALLIFDMVREAPEIQTIGALLLSPYISGAETELSLRARADVRLRKSKQPRMSVMQILAIMKGGGGHGAERGVICPRMVQLLERFEALCLDMPENQSLAQWCRTFSQLLETLGWPGEKPLDSYEYQIFMAFQEVLSGLSTAGEVTSGLSFFEAQDHLRRLLEETLFQPETEDVNLQIMGVLEAAGEQFDAIWVTGLNAEVWPLPPAPNPFIPVSLQRELGLPHASAVRELDFAGKVTARLLASADAVMTSYPLFSGDTPLSPSGLIEHLPEAASDPACNEEIIDYRLALAASGDKEDFQDEKGAPLKEDDRIDGGTGVLKSQSACPFSAFVKYRLGANPLEFPVSGLDGADRGTLVHKALEGVWQVLVDQGQLVSQTEEALLDIVSESVEKAISAMSKVRPRTFTGRFAAMETKRLHTLVMQWLEQDSARPFFEVISSERRLSVQVGGVRLNTFVDRIDRLTNNQLAIIDYKTGDVSIKDWFEQRIVEPQLPLYALGLEDVPAGIFFARVRKGEMKYVGIADDDSVVNGIVAVADTGGLNETFGNMADIVEFWKHSLAVIAAELASGHASVSPVSVNKSCRYCHLGLVCRIDELIEQGLVTV